jgi:single-stranded DNA-binding protein
MRTVRHPSARCRVKDLQEQPYLRFTIRDGDGAQWISIMAFDPKAVAAADRMKKGARVYVEGKITLERTGRQIAIAAP